MKKTLIIAMILVLLFSFSGCSAVNNSTASQPTTTTTTTTAVEESSLWEKQYYLDDFGQETTDWYIANTKKFVGKFSNSATTDSLLSVTVCIDKDIFSLFLYEYGTNQVNNPYSENEYYVVKIRDDNNDEYSGFGGVTSRGDRLVLNRNTQAKALEFMKTSSKVSFYIEEEEGMSSYLFTVDTDGFSSVMNS